jgi:hypothetical protein
MRTPHIGDLQRLIGVGLCALALFGCSSPPAPPVPPVSAPPPAPAAPTPGTTAAPAAAEPSPAAPTPGATAAPAAAEPAYLDDRSDGPALIRSLVNAISRKEYARAYSYWQNPGAVDLPPFAAFAQGYADTAGLSATLGSVGVDVGAGQIRYSVPVALAAAQADGSSRAYVGCYVLHLGNPGFQQDPPFQPLAIERAAIQQVSDQAAAAAQLGAACAQAGFAAADTPPPTPADIDAIGADVYRDARSSPAELLRSFYNAVNRREYSRAWSYWRPTGPAANFADFVAGYADTASVTIASGAPQQNAGAGQVYTDLPVTVVAQQNDGSRRTFVGCYTTHLANPQIQAAPPFVPLSIGSASISLVDTTADTAALMAAACANR